MEILRIIIGYQLEKLKSFFIPVLIASLMFGGCEKSDFGKENLSPKNQSSEGEGELAQKAYINNSHLGKHHNFALEELASHHQFPDSISGNEVYNTVKGYLQDSLSDNYSLTYSEIKNNYQNFIEDTAITKSALSSLERSYFTEYLIEETSFSSDANIYFSQLSDFYGNFQSVTSLKNDLDSLGTVAIKDNSLTHSEKEIITGLLAIAGESLNYWDNVLHKTGHPWHQPFTNNLSSSDEHDFMLNMSLFGACNYGIGFHETHENGYSVSNSHSAGVNQASVVPGPATIADIEM